MNHFQILLKNKLLYIMFIIITTISSGYPLSTIKGNKTSVLLLVFTIIIFIYFIINKNMKITLKMERSTIFYFIFIIGIISSCIGNLFISTPTIKIITVITYSYLFTQLISFEIFLNGYTKVMKWITLISLNIFILVNYFNMKLNLPIVENINGATYYNGVVFFLFKKYGTDRNLGIFWEPGLFASFLIIAIILESLKKKQSKINIMIYFIGIVSTKSTFAYLISILIIIYFLLLNSSKLKKKCVYLLSMMIIIVTIIEYNQIIRFLYNLSPELFGKILNSTNSLTERIESPLNNFKIFLDNPIFGLGIDKVNKIYETIIKTPQTSTSTFLLAAFGISGFLYTYLIYSGIWNLKFLSKSNRLIIIVIFLIIVNKEPHTNLSVIYILIFYFSKKIKRVSE